MAESVLKRVQRVVSAGVESAVDAAESLSGGSLMREAIREVDRAIEKLAADRQGARTRRLQAEHQQQTCRDALASLEEQARFALQKGRDDLAQAAVVRQLELETQIGRLAVMREEAAEEEKALDQSLTALRQRKAQMEADLRALEAARRAATAEAGPGARLDAKVTKAEAAFGRGISAAGGLRGVDAAAAVDEIEELRKQQVVADRLAALREAAAGGTQPARKNAKPARKRDAR